jgi:hypothetical protein
MDPITAILGSKLMMYMIFGTFAVLTLYGTYRLIRRAGRKDAENAAIIEGQDKALRGSEAARRIEGEGAKVRDQITGGSPSPHVKLRDSKVDKTPPA